MIDLTGAKVGDEFVGLNDETAEVVGVTDKVKLLRSNTFSYPVDNYGVSYHSRRQVIFAKHEPRPWLKDLPDADLFSDEIKWVGFCRDTDEWKGFEFEPMTYHSGWQTSNSNHQLYMISGFKMPTLTGDQWKDSKVSILALKTWQLANQ